MAKLYCADFDRSFIRLCINFSRNKCFFNLNEFVTRNNLNKKKVYCDHNHNMDKRTLFYWSKIFSEQLKEGQPYNELKKTITINILDFNYVRTEKYSTVFHLWEDSNKDCMLTDVLEIRFLELPKFRKKQPDLSKPMDRWIVFIEDSPGGGESHAIA